MNLKVVDPDFRWIEVITTVALSTLVSALVGVGITYGLEISDTLGAIGAIAGAGLGAWLVASAARASAIAQAQALVRERRAFVRQVLQTVGEEMAGGSTADTESRLLDFNASFGENQLRRHAQRANLALALAEDANTRVGADFRALRALHTAIRSLRQTQDQIKRELERERGGAFGRDAMRFIQTNRNSIRISIQLAQRTLDGHDKSSGSFAGLFNPARAATPSVNEDQDG